MRLLSTQWERRPIMSKWDAPIDPMGILARREEEEARWHAEQEFLRDNANDAVEYADSDVLIAELVSRGYPLWLEYDGRKEKLTADNLENYAW